MITLKLKDGTKHMFNLKSFDRERALHDAWYSMSGDPKFESKKLKITMDTGETIQPVISDIEDIKFEESEYYRATRVGSVQEDRERRQRQQQKPRSDGEKAMDWLNKKKTERLDKFSDMMRKQGFDIDFDKL